MQNFKPVVNFYINTDSRIKSIERRIMLFVRGFGTGNTIKISTPFKVNPKFWDNSKQTFKKNSQAYYDYSNALVNMKSKVEKAIISDLPDIKPNYTFKEAKTYIEELFLVKEQEIQRSKSFFEYYDEYLEDCKLTLSLSFIKKLKTYKNHFLEFEKLKQKKDKSYSITFEQIDNQFFRELHQFYIKEKNIANNTTARYLKAFKTFLRKCIEKGLNYDLSKITYSLKVQDTELIALTNDELQRIIDLDLTQNVKLDKVRDLFLFSVYTGQRFSDVSQIKTQDVVENVWRLQTQKTKTFNLVPLSSNAVKIYNKYKETSFPKISNQKCNDYLKEIGKLAELNTQLTITRYKGAVAVVKTFFKYELLTTHTARRTFVTLSLQKGMRVDTLKSITGHKDHRSYEKYIKEDIANKISELHNAWD